YVAADDGRNENHRMYVLEGDARDPQAPYQWRGRMAARTDRWAIDGTILSLPDGRRYFVWSGWEGTENVAQHLYLARLSSAVSIDGERVRISTPEHPWDCHGQPWVNEGPQVLWRGDRLFLVYSASGSWTDDYCLGLLEWTGGDPMEAASWKKRGTPLFSRTAQVFGPGHCCFVTSPDGVETWIVYHSARTKGSGWDRQISMQPLGWDTEGRPQLGEPVAPGRPLALPSWSRALRPSPSSASPPPDGAPVP
ncbi:MAG: glycoside hydrolase family 43 protein, partial [Verrucomicrobiales bacterium]|nr:glycoside hydrolase family 43 protein [Verrucomicrobiales bacterium]